MLSTATPVIEARPGPETMAPAFEAFRDAYMVIFTQNATGALKLIGEAYPFGPGDHYLLTADNHNSVNGIREFARAKGATVTYAPLIPPACAPMTWIQSYVSAERRRTYCLCAAPSPEAVRRAAMRNGLPVDRITEVRVLDPYAGA